MSDLLPCPFCGGEAKLITWHEHTEARHVQCTNCRCMTGAPHFERRYAIHDWNSRVGETKVTSAGEIIEDGIMRNTPWNG